jgi:hypothetical protein
MEEAGAEFKKEISDNRMFSRQNTEAGRNTTYEESADISRRLDSLETELNRFR